MLLPAGPEKTWANEMYRLLNRYLPTRRVAGLFWPVERLNTLRLNAWRIEPNREHRNPWLTIELMSDIPTFRARRVMMSDWDIGGSAVSVTLGSDAGPR